MLLKNNEKQTMLPKMKFGKRAETDTAVTYDGIQLFLGALVFLAILFILSLVLQYFWPPPDTDMIAINSVADTIEFSLQNLPINEGQTITVTVPIQLKDGSGIEVVSPGYEGKDSLYPQICLRQSKVRKDCRTLTSVNVASIAIDHQGEEGQVDVNTGFIYTPNNKQSQNIVISFYENKASIDPKKSYNINLIVPHTK